MLAMQVADVTLRDDQSASVLLVEDTQQIRLRFRTTYAGGEAILAALHQPPAIRPPTQVLLLDALKRFDVNVRRATIDELRDILLYAHLELQSSGGKNVTVDALPSDVVSVALRTGVPLEVSEQVVAAMGCRRGQLIDVGGYQLSAHVKGSGGPAVVLESSFGSGYELWSKVQDSIAQFTTVCSYDRAGLGWSDFVSRPRTFQDSVRDLHVLLQRLTLPTPYVLVGSSIGGPLGLLYACTYSAEMAGLVLVDSSHPDQRARFLTILPSEDVGEPPNVREYRKSLLSPAFLGLEWDDATICFEEAQGCRTLGDLPLAVITAGKPWNPFDPSDERTARHDQIWRDLQMELVQLSSRSTQRFAEQSGHMVPFEQPEIVIDAIRELVETIRQHESQSLTAAA